MSRCRPNTREASRTLIPSTIQARRTRTYISTVNIHLTLQRLLINLTEGGGRYSFATPQADYRAAHLAHFTAAFYRLDGRLTVRHEGHIVAAQEAPPSPVFLRNAYGRSPTAPVLPSVANGLGQHWTATLEPLDSRATDENGHGMIIDGVARADKPAATSARKPTFLQRERWKAIQKARRKGMSLRTIERELGIHRSTIRKYLDAEGPPTRQSKAAPTASASDTIAA